MSGTNQNVGQFYGFLRSVKQSPELLAKYEGNSAGLFKDGGLDINNLPPEILKKISAAGISMNDVKEGVEIAASVAGIMAIFL